MLLSFSIPSISAGKIGVSSYAHGRLLTVAIMYTYQFSLHRGGRTEAAFATGIPITTGKESISLDGSCNLGVIILDPSYDED